MVWILLCMATALPATGARSAPNDLDRLRAELKDIFEQSLERQAQRAEEMDFLKSFLEQNRELLQAATEERELYLSMEPEMIQRRLDQEELRSLRRQRDDMVRDRADQSEIQRIQEQIRNVETRVRFFEAQFAPQLMRLREFRWRIGYARNQVGQLFAARRRLRELSTLCLEAQFLLDRFNEALAAIDQALEQGYFSQAKRLINHAFSMVPSLP